MLPQFPTTDRPLSLLQIQWAEQLNPVIVNPLMSGFVLQEVALTSGDNTINHLLGRALKGWFVVRKRAAAEIYDKQDSNRLPTKTLVLNSNATVSVDLYVF